MMAARQARSRKAPFPQQEDSEPPVFIPLDPATNAEQQVSSSQPQAAPRSQKTPRKQPGAQQARESFQDQRRELHQGRRAKQEQNEVPTSSAAASELRAELRQMYFDMAEEESSIGQTDSNKPPDARRKSPKAQATRDSKRQEIPSQEGRNVESMASTSGRPRSSQGERRAFQQPSHSNGAAEQSYRGERAAGGQGSKPARGRAGIPGDASARKLPTTGQQDRRAESSGRQRDATRSGSSQVKLPSLPTLLGMVP